MLGSKGDRGGKEVLTFLRRKTKNGEMFSATRAHTALAMERSAERSAEPTEEHLCVFEHLQSLGTNQTELAREEKKQEIATEEGT